MLKIKTDGQSGHTLTYEQCCRKPGVYKIANSSDIMLVTTVLNNPIVFTEFDARVVTDHLLQYLKGCDFYYSGHEIQVTVI